MKKIIIIALVLAVVASLSIGSVVLADKPAGSGAGKAFLYNSNAFTCEAGATDMRDGPYGFVIMNTNASGKLIVQVALKGATPNATYDIWVNQWPGACPLSSPTAPEVLTTNGKGNGNAHVMIDRNATATNFWISAVGGGQVLRSTSVVLD